MNVYSSIFLFLELYMFNCSKAVVFYLILMHLLLIHFLKEAALVPIPQCHPHSNKPSSDWLNIICIFFI